MSYQALAFFTGLFGSLHCVAMCGPLMFSIPLGNNSSWQMLLQRILYQAGRIATYIILGSIAGSIGTAFNIIGWQKALSIVSGAILVIVGAAHLSPRLFKPVKFQIFKLTPKFSKLLAKFLISSYGGFIAGLLNGLLPCAMVYMALVGAINTDSAIEGSTYMLCFGLGTSPLLILTGIFPLLFRKRLSLGKFSYLLFIVIGAWLIFARNQFKHSFNASSKRRTYRMQVGPFCKYYYPFKTSVFFGVISDALFTSLFLNYIRNSSLVNLFVKVVQRRITRKSLIDVATAIFFI